MNTYRALTEMGIVNPTQISRYSLHTIHDMDVLRIIYKRTKGSILPVSKKFKFPREQKTVRVDSANNTSKTVSEISPFLLEVTDELRSLVKGNYSRTEAKAIIADEVRRMEEEVTTRLAYIKSLVEKLD